MKSPYSLILSAAVLATVALPTMLRAQTPAPEALSEPQSQAVAESDPGLREIERKVLLKHFAAAVKELKGVEEALMNSTTPEQKAVASKVAEKHRKWVDELKARLAQAEPGDDPKTVAMTKKLDAIVIRYSAFREATLREVIHHLINRGKEADPDKTGVPIRFSLMDKEDECPITFHLENATLHLLLQVVAEQAGLTLDIGEEIVSLRKQTGNLAEPGQLVQPAAPVEEDVAFFEKKYRKKITGVKPKGEYADPDQFYSAIAKQLGIPEIAWKAAAEKYGWKKDDGKNTFTMLKGGPTAGGGQGTWDVMFIRSAINPETKKPDPATMEQVMLQIDYDGGIKFIETPRLAGCDSERSNEVTGTRAERIKIVSRIIASNTPLPGALLDANFVQEVIGDGRIGPSDVKSFGVLSVPPEDLPAWRAVLAPLEAQNTPAAYAAPKQACPWWLHATEFSSLKFHSPKSLTGRVNGWVGIAPDGRIFMYSFSM